MGIKDSPIIKIPILSLQSNALVAGNLKSKNRTRGSHTRHNKKVKLRTNILHDRFHRSDRMFATIKAHDLLEDVYITPGIDSIYTSCKIMTDTEPKTETLGLSPESRYNYFRILCDRFSRTLDFKIQIFALAG